MGVYIMETYQIILYLVGLVILIILCFTTDGIPKKIIKYITILYIIPLIFFLFMMYEILKHLDD